MYFFVGNKNSYTWRNLFGMELECISFVSTLDGWQFKVFNSCCGTIPCVVFGSISSNVSGSLSMTISSSSLEGWRDFTYKFSGSKKWKKSQYKHFKITICNYISQQDTEITLNMTKNKTVSNRLIILDSC